MAFDSPIIFDLPGQPFDAGTWPPVTSPVIPLPGTPIPIPQTGFYVTKSEDCWDLISFKVFQTEAYRSQLIDANPQYSNVMIFDSGVRLMLPEIVTVASMTLPPWLSGATLTP
jgi:hypothetical protein